MKGFLVWLVLNVVTAVPTALYVRHLRRKFQRARNDAGRLMRVLVDAYRDRQGTSHSAHRIHGHLMASAPHMHDLFHEAERLLDIDEGRQPNSGARCPASRLIDANGATAGKVTYDA